MGVGGGGGRASTNALGFTIYSGEVRAHAATPGLSKQLLQLGAVQT